MAESSPVHHILDEELPPPQAADAVRALEAQTDFVGITELLEESWCVLHFQLRGELPDGCSCLDDFALLTKSLPHEVHSLPRAGEAGHLNATMLDDATLAQIDAITEVDRLLYQAGLTRFFSVLDEVQTATGAQLICPERQQRHLAAAGWLGPLISPIDNHPNVQIGQMFDHYSNLGSRLNATGLLVPEAAYIFDLQTTNDVSNAFHTLYPQRR